MLTMRFPGGKPKALTLSYDDGVEQDRTLMEILDRHGLRCTFNLNSGCFAPEGHRWPEGQIHRRMSRSDVLALYGGTPHEVAVHTLTHPDLTRLPATEILREIYEDRKNLEALFGRIVRGAAYPYGTYSDEAVEALRQCGIVYCRTVSSSHDFQIPSDWLRLRPTCHHDDPDLEALCDRFLKDTGWFNSRLFYLWGHAYEFEANHNWDRIESFAAKMGGHDDIWYCTNIQVVDYVRAWQGLEVSLDRLRIHNPSDVTLWAETAPGRMTVLDPGATVTVD